MLIKQKRATNSLLLREIIYNSVQILSSVITCITICIALLSDEFR